MGLTREWEKNQKKGSRTAAGRARYHKDRVSAAVEVLPDLMM
jgi:hypothetical protein